MPRALAPLILLLAGRTVYQAEPLDLTGPSRIHPGDNAEYLDPGFDDSAKSTFENSKIFLRPQNQSLPDEAQSSPTGF